MQCGISQCFFDMLGEIFAGRRQPVDCAGQSLHRSELRLMQLIGEAPQLNVSELSERAGVTKSAVTQMSGKLCEKGLIDARKNPHNKKEKYFCLTQSGRSALDAYENANRRAAAGMREYLCALSADEKKTIMDFMKTAREYMPSFSFSCRCEEGGGASCLSAGEGRKNDA